jgi:hypothetical protein
LEQKINQWGEEDPRIWEDFKKYIDPGTELDIYNTQFNQLLQQCDWKCNKEGTMQMYHRGLTAPLLRRMLE